MTRSLGGNATICFVFNNVHYARYRTYYVNQMKRLEETHPRARNEIKEYGLSACRNDFGIRQAVDLAGEQTFMKPAKTAGSYYFLHIF